MQKQGFSISESISASQNQEELFPETYRILLTMAQDVREGLFDTVGVESEISLDGDYCSMILKLPPETDTRMIAEAIVLENADAWCDETARVNLGINPQFSVKDIDQTVLCAIKVIHVMLGLHAVCEVQPKSFTQKILASVMEIMQAQQKISRK